MSFDWKDYLTLAEKLAEDASSNVLAEAMWRASLSLAYYAAFNTILEYLKDKDGFVPQRKGSVHSEVRKNLKNPQADTERQRIGSYLEELWGWRLKADYHKQVSVSWQSQVSAELRRADTILETLDELD